MAEVRSLGLPVPTRSTPGSGRQGEIPDLFHFPVQLGCMSAHHEILNTKECLYSPVYTKRDNQTNLGTLSLDKEIS
jgi:hypothetical protein